MKRFYIKGENVMSKKTIVELLEEQEKLRTEMLDVMQEANKEGWTFKILVRAKILEDRIDKLEANMEKYQKETETE